MIEDITGECEAIADELAGQHEAYFAANPYGLLVQHCLAWLPNGDAVSIMCGWRDARQRRSTLETLRTFMATSGVCRYAIVAGVWVVLVPAGEAARKAAEQRFGDNYAIGDLASDPERMECVFSLVVDASGVQANRLQKVVRNTDGRVVMLHTMPAQAGLGGAFASLLQPRTLN